MGVDASGGSGGWDSKSYRQFMREIIVNAADPRLDIVWLSPEAEVRYENYIEENALKCAECGIALRIKGAPVTDEDIFPPGKTVRCNECEQKR